MFRTNFKIGIRNLVKNKLHSAINVIGLAVGLTAVLSIAIYLQHELSYDNFHKNGDQLYRMGMKAFRQGQKLTDGYTFTPPVGPAMKAELAGIKNYTRYRMPQEAYLSVDKKAIKTDQLLYADSTFFELFSFPILKSNTSEVLNSPYSLVLTESMADRLFGAKEALGKTVYLNNGDALQVSAIAADPPTNSHIEFSALISFSTLYKDKGNHMDWNGGEQYITYVQLEEKTSTTDINQQLPDFMWQHINKAYSNHNILLEANLQALPAIHLWHNYYSESLLTNIYILAALALLVLIIACINFVNLSTARASRRGKEIGVRKVMGATKASLSAQFLLEAFLLTGTAFILSLFLLEASLPYLSNLFGKTIYVPALLKWSSFMALTLLFLIVGFGAGSYPALYMSSLDTIKTIKGLHIGLAKSKFRNALVVFQFCISVILIISVLVVSKQLNFVNTKNLGFDKEQVLVVPLLGQEVQSKVKLLKQTLKEAPQIITAAACSETPGNDYTQNGYRPEGVENPMLIKVVDVDEDYFDLFGLKLLEGRILSTAKPADQNAYMINEALANTLDWQSPIGKTIKRNGTHEIVGLIKDFHYASFHKNIEPLIITCKPWQNHFDYLAIKLSAGDVLAGINASKNAWEKVLPNVPMDHWFLDDELNQIYQSEKQLKEAFFLFAGLSIFIAIMGILGLASFTVEQRKKEIGIRKVLGANSILIIQLLSKDFVKLVFIALIIASPIAWILLQNWLENYAYRIEIQWWMFAFAGVIAMSLAFLTVSFQSLRTALANPVDSLRSE